MGYNIKALFIIDKFELILKINNIKNKIINIKKYRWILLIIFLLFYSRKSTKR